MAPSLKFFLLTFLVMLLFSNNFSITTARLVSDRMLSANSLGGAVHGLVGGLGSGVGEVGSTVGSVVGSVGSAVGSVVGGVGSAVGSVVGGAQGIGRVVGGVGGVPSGLRNSIASPPGSN